LIGDKDRDVLREKDKDLLSDKDRIRLEIGLPCNLVLHKESNITRKTAFGSTKPGCFLPLVSNLEDPGS
jgi:hypothetical protein